MGRRLTVVLVAIISFAFNGRTQSIIDEIQTDLAQLKIEPNADELTELSDKTLETIRASGDQSESLKLIIILIDLSKIKPLPPVGTALAKSIDIYIRKFQADGIDLWQPVFNFMWYNIRKTTEPTIPSQIERVQQHKDYLNAVYETSGSDHLKAMSLYIKVENSLFLEREVMVLEKLDREEAINDAKTLLGSYGLLKKPNKKNPRWDETYAYYARGQLVELQDLHIGAKALDIQGRDLEGLTFKLSDYRGNIVVLSFWGAWCAPCIEAVPKERALVNRNRNKPFVLLGINTDAELDKAIAAVEKHDINWRSFWNGLDGWQGNIAYDWFVQGYPLYYVLDSEGRIHFKSRGYEGLEDKVETLLAEMGNE